VNAATAAPSPVPSEAPATPVPALWQPAPLPAAGDDAERLADALSAGQLSPRTRRAYASDLAEFRSILRAADLALGDVTRDFLLAYRRWLNGSGSLPGGVEQKEKPCAPATISRKISVVRQFFAEAHDRGLIATNPAARLRGMQTIGESKTLGLSRRQAHDLLATIPEHSLLGIRDRAVLALMLRTGLRRMDVLGATCGAVRETQGHHVLHIARSKGDKDRVVKLPPDVWRSLETWRSAAQNAGRIERDDGGTPLFCAVLKNNTVAAKGQRPLSEKAIWKIVTGRAKAAGIGENITPHSTRHTFITLALDGGAPLHKVQAAAGHADPRTTERYWRTQQNLDDNAVDYVRI